MLGGITMDYILHLIDRKINYYEALNKTRELTEYHRVKIEYGLIFLMSYLWNENFDTLDTETKEYILEKVNLPSIGSIVDISRKLDVMKKVFTNKKFNEAINGYPKLRNERIGHGYTFEDGIDDYLDNLKRISQLIYETTLLKSNNDLVIVLDHINGKYVGMNYKSDGTTFVPWGCPEQIFKFQLGNTYLLDANSHYNRISPFIHLSSEEEFYLFKNIEENLIGKIRYNQLLRTGSYSKEWDELSNISIENSAIRRKSVNGTVVSIIHKNYKRYIEIGVMKKKIANFLVRDRASVCATIWGHGGVGKTATVQSICDDFSNDPVRKFDYIVFASAKDRYYNYYTGSIDPIDENINSFDGLICSINRVMFNEETNDYEKIVKADCRVLIIIDDYETFPNEEKKKIEDFIRTLDINHHKVLVTTRANLIIGDEFQTNELDTEDTKSFLIEILKSEFDHYKVEKFEKDLLDGEKYKIVHNITNGRPLFVYQFAYIWMQVGKIEEALYRKIKQEKNAIDFLYGRIYEYLSPAAKDIFVAISQIVDDSDLENLIEKVRYILNLENSDKFDGGIRELEKLRIIEIIETKFFRVYSKEILHTMCLHFDKRNDSFKGSIISRIQQVTKDKRLDNEKALLYNANAARTSRNEEEVISLYRSILKRETSRLDIKVQAILNLADYLFNSRGKRDETIKLFKDYAHIFSLEPAYIRMYATYCWATGRKEESIQSLLELFAKNHKQLIQNRNLYLELLGLLLMYRSIDAIQQRVELKEKERFGEIEHQDFLMRYKQSKELFIDICNKQGNLLFSELKKVSEASSLSSGARQNVIAGLYQYVNLNIRLNRLRDAADICQYAIDNFPMHLYDQFKAKLEFCQKKL